MLLSAKLAKLSVVREELTMPMACLLVSHVKGCDGYATVERRIRLRNLPRVGDTIVVDEEDDYSCNRIQYVCHISESLQPDEEVPLLILEDDSDPDSTLGEILNWYSDGGWVVRQERPNDNNGVVSSGESYAETPPPQFFRLDDAELIEIEPTAEVLPRWRTEMDRRIEAVPPEVRDAIVRRHLRKLREEGRHPNESAINIQVVVVSATGEESFRGLRLMNRVPGIGDSVEIFGDDYRVMNVSHTPPEFGYLARVFALPLHDVPHRAQ